MQNGSFADCFGMTKDSTSCYMFVMRYYENGNLYSYLEESKLCTKSAGLNLIHECDPVDTKIANTWLHGPVDEQILPKKVGLHDSRLVQEIISLGSRLSIVNGTPPVCSNSIFELILYIHMIFSIYNLN